MALKSKYIKTGKELCLYPRIHAAYQTPRPNNSNTVWIKKNTKKAKILKCLLTIRVRRGESVSYTELDLELAVIFTLFRIIFVSIQNVNKE